MSTSTQTPESAPTTAADSRERSDFAQRVIRGLSPSKIGGVYVLLIMIVVFSIWVPDVFPQWDTARQILNSNAISAMAALTLVIPLSAGVFDISVPYTMTLSGVLCTYAIVNSGQSVGVAILIALVASVIVGIMNGLVVVTFKIDSLIGTLATGFLIQSLVQWRTGSRNVTGPQLSGTFQDIAQKRVGNLTLPVFYALIMAFVIWYLQDHTATGRRIYATGFNRDATRLASVRTERLRFGCLMTSATLAGITGIVLASNIGSGSPTAGISYLLPAFAAVFLGATQLKNGRFNAWGTIIAVLLLGTLTTGLGLAGVDQWVQQFATGVVLIAALALTGFQVRRAGAESKRARTRHQSSGSPGGAAAPRTSAA
jgi:ribose/xylose/arabinose/galactoside ABC-type transport system permease subunit